jgi:protein O-GlcNAc transferase
MNRSRADLLAASAWQLHRAGNLEAAIPLYREALTAAPDYAEIHNNLGNALLAAGRLDEAIDSLRLATKYNPNLATAHSNLGLALADSGDISGAIACHSMALQLQPGMAGLHNNLGTALLAAERFTEAEASYREAIRLHGDFAEAWGNLGDALRRQSKYADAAAAFRRAWQIKPDFNRAMAQFAFMQRTICDWREMPPLSAFESAAASNEKGNLAFAFLALSDDPAAQLRMARHDSRVLAPAKSPPLWQGRRPAHERIRLAYLSADFCEHAVAYLVAELFEIHDRQRFEIAAFSFGPNDASAMRWRLERAFDHFFDVRALSDLDVAGKVYEWGADIAIDLMGHTRLSRPGILANRPAPIQVNYLGYPGSMGASFVDYAIVDRFVVPDGEQGNFDEKLVYLPHCYQANDSKRPISADFPSRAMYGLPEKEFVFCSFNNTFKISPAMFGVWMEILLAVPGSVLWLLGDNPWAIENLRREAASRDVDPTRLVFASRASLADHLARHRLADLFLDTLPYNAHTTASDALWAGLPILTCPGRSFPARVAGSLLHAIGLPELVTGSLDDYRAKAIDLGLRPEALGAIRERLARNRLSMPLFDSVRYGRDLETAYLQMWALRQNGELPQSFAIPTAS